jgi:hypothetical protein
MMMLLYRVSRSVEDTESTNGNTDDTDDTDDPQVRGLREQFARVKPESLCLPGGVTRSELVEFLTILADTTPSRRAPLTDRPASGDLPAVCAHTKNNGTKAPLAAARVEGRPEPPVLGRSHATRRERSVPGWGYLGRSERVGQRRPRLSTDTAGVIVTDVRDGRDSGLRAVLAELRFPAPVWLLVAQAHSWGADAECVEQLNHLPIKDYQQLDDVLRALDRRSRTRRRRAGRWITPSSRTDRINTVPIVNDLL